MSRPTRSVHGTSVLAFLFVVGPCVLVSGCKVATQTDLRFSAGPENQRRAAAMRVEVRDRSDNIALMIERSFVGDSALPWPNTLTLVPRDGDSRFSVVAELVDETGAVFAVQRLRSGFVSREHIVLEVNFEDECIGVFCTPTTTCNTGICIDAFRIPGIETNRAEQQAGVCFNGLCFEHPRPGGITYVGSCISGDEGDLGLELLVGSNGAVIRRVADLWVQEPYMTSEHLNGVECWELETIVVGAEDTVLLRDEGGAWRVENTGAGGDLEAVSGVTPMDAWVVGAEGVAMRRTPSGWEAMATGTTNDFADVWSPRREEAWITDGGPLLHYFDGAWESVPAPGNGASRVTGRDGELIVIGRADGTAYPMVQGNIEHRDGDSWSRESRAGATPNAASSTAIDLDADGNFSVGGASGEEWRFDAGTLEWQRVARGARLTTTSVLGDRALYGGRTLISRWDGASVERESVVLTDSTLRDVAHSARDGLTALAVGADGTILRRPVRGRWQLEPLVDGEVVLTSELFAVTTTPSGWLLAGDGVLVERAYGDAPGYVIDRSVPTVLRAFANDGSRIVAVGEMGVIVERDVAGRWSSFADPFPSPLTLITAVWERPGVLVVGALTGEIWRYDGTWQLVTTLVSQVRCLALVSGTLMACGGGRLRSISGITVTIPDSTFTNPADLAVDSAGEVLFGADNSGRVWVPNDSGYERLLNHRSANLISVSASSVGTDDVLFVGGRGSILSIDR